MADIDKTAAERVAPDLLRELEAAHKIIQNADKIMTASQRAEWQRANEPLLSPDCVGFTRSHERLLVIDRATDFEL